MIVRFWIVAGLAVAFGLGVFYAEYLSQGPLGYECARHARRLPGLGSPMVTLAP